MSLDWQGAWQALIHHPLFGFMITLGAYQVALWLYERTRSIFLQPILLSILLVISILLLCDLSAEEYRQSTQILSLLIGPATVALAVPLYLNLRRIRLLLAPILLTLLFGGVFACVSGVLLAWLFGASDTVLMSMATKSVTAPIAMLVTEQIGGIASLAAIFVMITGVLGAMFGPELLRLVGVTHPAAQGMALGVTAHAVGTSRAIQVDEECGAFAALGMSLMGAFVALLLPLVVVLIK